MGYIKSYTARKEGWGSQCWRSVRGLTTVEKEAIKSGKDQVYFTINPWHWKQSGYKVVFEWANNRFDCCEPTPDQLVELQAFETTMADANKENK
jgi:hypothetical protein